MADPLAVELRLYALPPEGSVGEFLIRLVGSLQIDLGVSGPASPCAMATHPTAPLAYLLCTRTADGAGLIAVCELSSDAPPTIVEIFIMSAPGGGGTKKSGAAATAGEAEADAIGDGRFVDRARERRRWARRLITAQPDDLHAALLGAFGSAWERWGETRADERRR